MKSILFVALLSICTLSAFPSKTEAAKENRHQTVIAVLNKKCELIKKEKTYCSSFAKTRYKLLIIKDKIRITRLYKEYKDVFTGVIKKTKIYSNDPNEKNLARVGQALQT